MAIGEAIRPRPAQPLTYLTERRAKCRFHTVMRVARVRRADDVGIWRVRNISDEGMMLATAVPVAPGETLSIALSDKVTLEGKAVWWDGERCGVAFDRPVDCAALLHDLVADQRAPGYRPLRLPVDIRATAYCDKGLHGVRLYDLSSYGVAFHHDGCFAPDMNVKLVFPSGNEHRGVVRWSRDGAAGVLLTEPFPCAQLESARRI